MSKKTASQKENTGLEKLSAFSELVHGTSQSLRNHLNESQLSEWLEEVTSEKLVLTAEESATTRDSLCRLWIAKVEYGAIVRKGEYDKASLSKKKDLALGPEWLRRAASGGASFTRLLMTKNEHAELCSILDWLRSDQGPSMASDWSSTQINQRGGDGLKPGMIHEGV